MYGSPSPFHARLRTKTTGHPEEIGATDAAYVRDKVQRNARLSFAYIYKKAQLRIASTDILYASFLFVRSSVVYHRSEILQANHCGLHLPSNQKI